MKAYKIKNRSEDALYHHCFIIGIIISYDDRNVLVVLNHTSRSSQCQVLKSSKEKPDD